MTVTAHVGFVPLLQNPFKHLYRDHDIEGMTDGFDKPTSYGHIDGIDDPSMGWARYAQVKISKRHTASGRDLMFYLSLEKGGRLTADHEYCRKMSAAAETTPL